MKAPVSRADLQSAMQHKLGMAVPRSGRAGWLAVRHTVGRDACDSICKLPACLHRGSDDQVEQGNVMVEAIAVAPKQHSSRKTG